jgi:hypothetical protein
VNGKDPHESEVAGRSRAALDDFDFVMAFSAAHERTYGAVYDGGAPWDDGSDTAALLAIWRHLERQIENGGWPAVFYNFKGWTVPLAARGYWLLEMTDCAQRCELAMTLVRRVEAAHPGLDYTSRVWLSETLVAGIEAAEWDRLDDGWYEITSETPQRIARYLRNRGWTPPASTKSG